MASVAVLYYFSERSGLNKNKHIWNSKDNAESERMKALIEHLNLIIRALTILAVMLSEFLISLFICVYALSLKGQIASQVGALSSELLTLFILVLVVGAALFAAGVTGVVLVMHSGYRTTEMLGDFFSLQSKNKILAQERLEAVMKQRVYQHYSHEVLARAPVPAAHNSQTQ